MSKTEDAPYELFKQALTTTTKAMSAEREIEVAFSGDGPRAEEKRIVLPPPPRDMSPLMAARARGEADAAALRLAHHDPVAHEQNRPQTEVGRQVYEAAERARI
ncbi:MAG: cobaltochelatase subunit CobT, partial [Pseudomonadota bacterium]